MYSCIDLHNHKQITEEHVVSIGSVMPCDTIPSHLFTMGIHPWYVSPDSFENDLSELKRITMHNRCVGIGEAGLDNHRGASAEWQLKAWQAQVEWSVECGKPLVVHCVGMHQEIIRWSKRYPKHPWWILHDYHGNRYETQGALSHNIAFSLGSRLLHNRISTLDWWKHVPMDRLFLETDNSGVAIAEVYRQASELYEVDINLLKMSVSDNFNRIFNGSKLA